MLDTLLMAVMISIGFAAVSLAITKAKVGEPLRNLVAKAKIEKLTYMVGCPFCMGFWITAVWAVFVGAEFTAALSVWGLQTLFVGLMMRALFLHEAEINLMQEEINNLRFEASTAYDNGWAAGVAEQIEK